MSRILHALHRKWNLFLVNKVLAGTSPRRFERKRRLLNAIGFEIGEGSKIVGPIFCTGKLEIGGNCWIGRNLRIDGNGSVTIGDNCDIAPEVIFETGGHRIGAPQRRAGKGENYRISVGDGTWICAGAMVLGAASVGSGCIVAALACVTKDVTDNTMVGGIPAHFIQELPI